MKLKQGATYKLIAALMASIFINGLAISVANAANEISRLVPFQARLHGTDNKAVADGVQNLTFNIYDTPTGGTPVWSESHNSVSVIHGYVNVLLGAINPMHETNYAVATTSPAYDASKSSVDFTKQKFLGISIGGGVEMFPRSQLVPSFHAFTANHADHATRADDADNADQLGDIVASSYALKTYVNAADTTLDTRITTEIALIDADTLALENKFSGTKAKNADLLDDKDISAFVLKDAQGRAPDANLLDGINSSEYLRIKSTGSATDPNETTTGYILTNHANSPGLSRFWHITTNFYSSIGGNASQHAISYNGAGTLSYVRHRYNGAWQAWARTDAGAKSADANLLDGVDSANYAQTNKHETFTTHITVANDILVGKNGGSDTNVRFYDDNSNTERTLKWDDGNNRFEIEQNDNTFIPISGGLKEIYDWKGVYISTATAALDTPGVYHYIVHDNRGTYWSGSLVKSSTGQLVRSGFSGSSNISSNGKSWSTNWGGFYKIYKVMAPVY
jgi:hypothetical protein